MPLQQILPTWVALNNANLTSPTGLTDQYTGQQIAGGGLNLGDYFDVTNSEAAGASYTTNGTLFSGRYRYVQVDSGATASNVKTGTIGYLRSGTFVASVVITAAGSGQTPGTYTIAASTASGGGVGAIIQVVVGAAGTITSVSVVNGGYGYVTVPTFYLTALGGTTGTVAAQLNNTPNVVTSYDVATGLDVTSTVRPIVFLNAITPGNYGFVQELGLATVLGNASVGSGAVGDYVNATTGGTVTTTASSGSPVGATVGKAIDLPQASNLYKCYLTGIPVVQD